MKPLPLTYIRNQNVLVVSSKDFSFYPKEPQLCHVVWLSMNKICLTTASPPWGPPTIFVETTGGVAGSLDGGHSLRHTMLASGQTPTKSLGATFLTTFIFLISRIIY